MVDRTGLQPGGLQPPEAAFDPRHAGVPQRALRRVEGVVVGRHDERASILRCRRHLRGVETPTPPSLQAAVATEAARGHQLASCLGVLGLPGVERRALRPDQLQEPRPMGLLPLGLVGVWQTTSRRRRSPSPTHTSFTRRLSATSR